MKTKMMILVIIDAIGYLLHLRAFVTEDATATATTTTTASTTTTTSTTNAAQLCIHGSTQQF